MSPLLVLIAAGITYFIASGASQRAKSLWRNLPPSQRGTGNQPNIWLIPRGTRFRVAAEDTPGNRSVLQGLASQPGIDAIFLDAGTPWPDTAVPDDLWAVGPGYIRLDAFAVSTDVQLQGLFAVWTYNVNA